MCIRDRVYLGFDDQQEEQDSAATEVVRLRVKDFNREKPHMHAFFSHFRPDFLFSTLTEKMTQQHQQYQVSDQTWKLTFEVQKQINDMDEDQEESKQEAIFERTQIQVEILKVPGQDKYCVDFQRKAGSTILFYDKAGEYMELLKLCNNATLDEE